MHPNGFARLLLVVAHAGDDRIAITHRSVRFKRNWKRRVGREQRSVSRLGCGSRTAGGYGVFILIHRHGDVCGCDAIHVGLNRIASQIEQQIELTVTTQPESDTINSCTTIKEAIWVK